MASTRKSLPTPFMKQCFVTASVGINIVGHGCLLGYTSILLPQLNLPDSEVKLNPNAASWIAAIPAVAQLIGSFIAPPIMDRYGRRIAHFSATIFNLVGFLLLTITANFEVMFIARILQGLSLGMLSPLRSVLIGEYVSPKNRGALLTIVSLSQSFGIFFVQLVGSFLHWQTTALICAFFPFVSIIMTIYSPESPSFLVAKGRLEECKQVFRWLRGDDEESELQEMIQGRIMFERAAIAEKLRNNRNRLQNAISTIKKKELYKPIILMTHAHSLINFAGGTTMSTYAIIIIEAVMGPEVNGYFWMIFLGAQRLISNAVAIYIIYKIKRRTMMMATGGLSVCMQFALAAYLYLKQQGSLPYDPLWVPILLVNLKMFAVAVGMSPLPNVIGGEVFPLEYRGFGGTISMLTHTVIGFIVLKTFINSVDSIGIHGVYFLYGSILTYCMGVVWFLLPETKGKTLQQIEDEFRGQPLTAAEIEAKQSLNADPVAGYQRKMSERRYSTPIP